MIDAPLTCVASTNNPFLFVVGNACGDVSVFNMVLLATVARIKQATGVRQLLVVEDQRLLVLTTDGTLTAYGFPRNTHKPDKKQSSLPPLYSLTAADLMSGISGSVQTTDASATINRISKVYPSSSDIENPRESIFLEISNGRVLILNTKDPKKVRRTQEKMNELKDHASCVLVGEDLRVLVDKTGNVVLERGKAKNEKQASILCTLGNVDPILGISPGPHCKWMWIVQSLCVCRLGFRFNAAPRPLKTLVTGSN